jgi:hypothetical protein
MTFLPANIAQENIFFFSFFFYLNLREKIGKHIGLGHTKISYQYLKWEATVRKPVPSPPEEGNFRRK